MPLPEACQPYASGIAGPGATVSPMSPRQGWPLGLAQPRLAARSTPQFRTPGTALNAEPQTRHPSGPQDALGDGALMRLHARGDPRAAAILTARIGPRVLGFATRMLGGDRAEAEDITQEVMLRLWKAAPDWEEDGAAAPATWAFRVAQNLCIDQHRKRRRHGGGLEDAPEPMDPSPGAEARLQQAERVSALDTALATLPERQRAAVVLRHIEGWANPEIAVHLEVSVEAVESLTARGKRALAQALAHRKEELGHG